MKNLKKVASVDLPEFAQVLAETPEETKRYVTKAMAIADEFHRLLDERQLVQRVLAERLGISEAAVSKICSGRQNLSLKTIARMETVLHTDIITIATPAQRARAGFVNKEAYKTTFTETRKSFAGLFNGNYYNYRYHAV